MGMTHLKEEGLEIVGHVGDDDEEPGGDVDGEDSAQQSPGEYFDDIGKIFEDKYSSAALLPMSTT